MVGGGRGILGAGTEVAVTGPLRPRAWPGGQAHIVKRSRVCSWAAD